VSNAGDDYLCKLLFFTRHQYEDLLTPQYLQPKPTRAMHHASLFLLLFPPCIKHPRTHFYGLTCNIFFDFHFQAVAQVGIFNLPVGLA